ncbi:hypothetical protein [Limosilactobacillus reuteri]|nr:hypothetical protein [Limosilactobacillus reuteri]
MEINADALKNFQDSKFNFVDADGNDVDGTSACQVYSLNRKIVYAA